MLFLRRTALRFAGRCSRGAEHDMLDQPAKGTSREASIASYLESSIDVLRDAIAAFDDTRVDDAIGLIAYSLRHDRPLLICGNGGSASDAQHITGELVGRFLKERRALNAICLSANVSVLT